jgi:hypothetical protein
MRSAHLPFWRSRLARAAAGAAAAGLLATTLAGCVIGHAATPHPAPSGAARPEPPSAWQLTLNRVRPNGTVSTPTALAAFALAIGPVPGAHPVAGPAQVIGSGTIAVQWVLGHWRQLTRSQRRAVLHDLGVPARAINRLLARPLGTSPAAGPVGTSLMSFARLTSRASRAVTAAGNPNLPCLTADSSGAGPYRAQAAGIESDIAAHIGAGPFSREVYFSVNTAQLEGRSQMYTWGCTGAQPAPGGGAVRGCTVHVNPVVSGRNIPASDVHDYLIHELTHCYLFLRLGAVYSDLPAWYREGAPTWAMTVLGNGPNIESSFWLTYLNTPAWSLFQRSYDALGFFAHLAETGTDVWHKILPIGRALIRGWNTAGWLAAAPGLAFLDSWGPGYAQGRYPGIAWRTGGPNLPHYEGPVPQGTLGNGQTITVRSPAAGIGIIHVDLNAQVVLISGSASGRFSLDGGADATLAQAGATAYVTSGTPAHCPAAAPDAAAKLTPISSGLHYVALTGGLSAAAVQIEGQSLASFCATKTAACIVGHWTTTEFHATVPGLFSEKGAAGATMRIGADGSVTADFDPMAPIVFTGTMSAGTFTGSLRFGGQVSGKVRLPAGSATSGLWQPALGGSFDYTSLTVVAHITSPESLTIGPERVSQLGASLGGGRSSVVNGHPLGGGTWYCSGNTLVNRPPAGSSAAGTWTWTRTG